MSACVYVPAKTTDSTKVQHIVLIWLKDSGNKDHRQRIINVSRTFAAIKGVKNLRVGSVLPSNRKIVDSSFDIGISMSFESVEAMDVYINHIDHVKAVQNIIKPLTSKIRVYDFID